MLMPYAVHTVKSARYRFVLRAMRYIPTRRGGGGRGGGSVTVNERRHKASLRARNIIKVIFITVILHPVVSPNQQTNLANAPHADRPSGGSRSVTLEAFGTSVS